MIYLWIVSILTDGPSFPTKLDKSILRFFCALRFFSVRILHPIINISTSLVSPRIYCADAYGAHSSTSSLFSAFPHFLYMSSTLSLSSLSPESLCMYALMYHRTAWGSPATTGHSLLPCLPQWDPSSWLGVACSSSFSEHQEFFNYCLFGVKPLFRLGPKIEACKPPRIGLKVVSIIGMTHIYGARGILGGLTCPINIKIYYF